MIPDDMKPVRRRRALLVWMLAMLPVVLGAFYLGPWGPQARQAILLTWVAGYAAAMLLFVFCRCPGCGGLFHSVHLWHFPFFPRCRCCGRSCRRAGDQSNRPIS
jgi:hypothetical protein